MGDLSKRLCGALAIATLVACTRTVSDSSAMGIPSSLPDFAGPEWTTTSHVQEIVFDEVSYSVSRYKSVFVREGGHITGTYTIRIGDSIKIFEIIANESENFTYLHVECPTGQRGVMPFHANNPYKEFRRLGVIEVSGSPVAIYQTRISRGFSYPLDVKSQPSVASHTVHSFVVDDPSEYYDVTAITEDFQWLEVDFGSFRGWVPSDSAYMDKGGILIPTPYSDVSWELLNLGAQI